MAKKKAGSYKTPNTQASNLLPSVFNTDVNKKWLDSTLDQMISKGNLKNVEGYIGDKSGKNRFKEDIYLDNTDLSPAIVVTDKDKKVTNSITMSDIANAINTNFSEYNYNTAYATKSYSYRPPINIDKFVNYTNYAWVDQMPTYESIRTLTAATVGSVTSGSSYPASPSHGDYFALNDGVNTKTYQWDNVVKTWQPSGDTGSIYSNNGNNTGFTTVVNPVDLSASQLAYTIIDNNNTFNIADQMLIKFVGDGWHSDAHKRTYLVTGTGRNIKLIEVYSWADNSTRYPDTTKTTVTVGGIWDKSKVFTIQPNKQSKIWTTAQQYGVAEMIGYYNGDDNRLPIFDGFIFPSEESNKSSWITDELIMFADEWTQQNGSAMEATDYHKIFYTQLDSVTNDITITKLVDARIVGTNQKIQQFIVPGTSESILAKYKDRLSGFDILNWDKSTVVFTDKDYQVMETDSPYRTAWSRNNKWTDTDTLIKLDELIYGGINLKQLTDTRYIAKRPIMEFDGKLNLYNWADIDTNLGDSQWAGVIDTMVKPTGSYIPTESGGTYSFNLADVEIKAGQRITFTEGTLATNIWIVGSTGELTADITLQPNYCAYVREALPDTEDKNWNNSDVWYMGDAWSTGQQRTKVNQMPLFKLYTTSGQRLEYLEGAKFQGSRIFNYKIGTSIVDPELGIGLSYKDINGIGEYQFENYLFTEPHFQSITSQFNKDTNYHRQILGQNLFKVNNKLTNLYKQSEEISGAETLVTHDVVTSNADFTINVGHSSWRTDRRVVLHQQDKRCVVTELQNGVYLDKTNVDHTNIYVGKNIPVVFNNLLETGDVKFKTVAGVDIETTSQAGVTIARSGNDITLSLTTYSSKIIIDPVDGTLENDYTIIPLDNYDSIQHTVEVNGKQLSPNNYTINADTIVIPASVRLQKDDIVDLKYASNINTNRTTNSSLPNTLKHNANNEVIKTFTMSETMAHWQSIISSTPGFEGDIFGANNYEALNKQHYFGGEISIHNDLSIVHDALYANDTVNVTDALRTSGEDWDNFRNRFRAQVARLNERKTYLTVRELVDDAIESITITRSGGDLFKTSNMVYRTPIRVEEFIHADGDTVLPRIFLKDSIHSDDNIQDHVYVYISDNVAGTLTTRLAIKDIDYTQSGNLIEFIYQPLAMPNKGYPKITVYKRQMDDTCYVPPSLTKLKLAPGWSPEADTTNNILTGHDGTQWALKSTAELFNMIDANFDVVNACQFELEKRIYTGLVISDKINTDDESVESLQYGMVSKFTPSATRETWYTLETLNDLLGKSFAQWKAKNKLVDTAIVYSLADVDTWNFSSTYVNDRFGTNKVPGQWKGAYKVLFGTSTPDKTPWHMLGYAFKPTWWDNTYSWTNAPKRAALIKALKRGLVAVGRQDIEWANHLWDWDNKCPVTSAGVLETITTVLGTPQDIDKAKRFEFGDHAGLEAEWRVSASGQASIIDAIVKLNPTKASSIFYSPSVKVNTKEIDYLDKDSLEIYTTSSIPTPGKVYGRSVTDVEVTAIALFDTNTFVKLVGPDGSTEADITLSFDSRPGVYLPNETRRHVIGASISHRGRNLTTLPAIYTGFDNSQVVSSTFAFKTKEVEYVASGISQSLYNQTLRNNLDYNIDNLHTKIDTRLGTQLRGFSSKHLLEFKTQTYDETKHTLGESDFELSMYKSTPINIAIASEITVEYLAPGWKISGNGYGKQEFNFFEPDNTNSTSYTNVEVESTEVKKYKKFAPTHSILEYNATLNKIQDTYSFIRGYYAYLESIGFEFPYSGDSVAVEFVKWALTNPATTKTFDLGSNFKFRPTHGSVVELNTGVFKENTVTDTKGITVESDNLLVSRTEDVLSLETKDKTIIGSAGFVVVEYEHIALLNDKTTFGVIVHDDIKNVTQDKIAFRGLITDKWDGNKRAPGYLVFDDKIVENFDSSVQAVDDFYKTDSIDFNPTIRKLEDITIGNSNNELTISENEFDSITKRNYFQGLIKQRGTSSAFDKIERKFITDKLDVKVHEQYMLSRSYFGNKDRLDAIEFTLENNTFETSPQAIKFNNFISGETVYNDVLVYPPSDNRFVNPVKTVNAGSFAIGKTYTIAVAGTTDFTLIGATNSLSGTTFTATGSGTGTGTATTGTSFATRPITSVDVSNLTAGALLDTEAKYKTNLLNEIGNVYNELEDYAVIETWANNKSYKLSNLVRYQGGLYQCAVDSTTVSTVTDSISITGNATSPEFTSGTVVSIDGALFPISDSENQTQPITATGTVLNPVVAAPTASTTLTIDGQSVTLSNAGDVTVLTGVPASKTGNVVSPVFNSSNGFVTDKQLVINGTTVDFDITPPDVTQAFTGSNNGVTPNDVVENITATATQTYTITQALSGSTYSVSGVTVDGTANTDFTISGQDITFNTPTFAGGEAIVVTMTHATVVDLEDTFTIIQDIVGSPYTVKSVTVGGVAKTSPTHYSISGQDIVFTSGNEPADSSSIVVTVEHTPLGMTTAEIVTKINDTLVANGISITEPTGTPYVGNDAIQADLVANRLRIRYWATSPSSNLVLGASVNGTNEILGLETAQGTYPVGAIIETQEQDLTLNQVVTAITNTANLGHITATNSGGYLKLVSSADITDWTQRRTTLTVGGTQQLILGFPGDTSPSGIYAAAQPAVVVPVTLAKAVTQITNGLADPVAAGGSGTAVTGVTVSNAGNVLNITSANSTLTLADSGDAFLTQAGITSSGVISLISDSSQSNTFIPAEWTNVSHTDPALFNVWVSNDSDYQLTSIGGVKAKHFDWNVFQVQNNGLYTADLVNNPTDPLTKDEPCGICSGSMTADGNDAQVTVNKNHGLAIGDYVMLLNTTTTPNIDGIHKVTKIGSSTEFYVDRYIDKCGSASSVMLLRPTRFETIEDRNTALKSIQWNVPPNTLIFTDYDELETNSRTRSINVFQSIYPVVGGSTLTGSGYTSGYLYNEAVSNASVVTDSMSLIRHQSSRIVNTDLDNITVYDYDSNTPILDLELYDPLRGIIPGVADAEIDIKSVHDTAIYNTSTEETYEVDDDNAWGDAEVGKRWWDTGKVKYYDYDQGDIKDKASNWAKQFVGSEVVVWEWTKSSVAPDDYNKAVESNKVMYGNVASGTAYAEFDAIKNQNEYFYTLRSEWNASTTKYDSVYYFWVRGKETIGHPSKNIITSEVENIITDPSANGIYWFSVADNDAIIVSDIWDFVNKKVVLQLNKVVDHNHAQWILVGKDTDIIPDYWFTGLKNNLSQIDENTLRIPDYTNHPYARYGDDRANRQAWYDDIVAARLNALDIINRLLVSVNVYNDFRTKFLKAITDSTIPNDSWDWTDFVSPKHNYANTFAKVVENIDELNTLDTNEYQTARIEIINDDDIDRTEFYLYQYGEWCLTKKNNATIEWSKERLAKTYTWDMEPWDSLNWDNTAIADWWKALVTMLRDTLFLNEHTVKFNKFFFGMIDYALSRTKQVEWAMKTSYIRLEVKSDLVEKKKYKKDIMSSIEGYINEIKPFHVKVSESARTFNKQEDVYFELEESNLKIIEIKHEEKGTNFNELVLDANNIVEKDIVLANNGTTVYTIDKTDTNMLEWDHVTVKDGSTVLTSSVDYFLIDQVINFVTAPTGIVTVTVAVEDKVIVSGGVGNTVFDDDDGVKGYAIVSGGNGRQPELYSNTTYRSTDADIRPQETAIIKVQTNRSGSTDTTETRTFAYMLDINKYQHVYGMEDAKTSTLSATLTIGDATLTVADASKFTTAELVLVNNEIIQVQNVGGVIYIKKRGLNLTFANAHASGTTITDVTNNALHYVNSSANKKFNDDNTTILDSSTSAEASMLNNIGKGTIL